MVASKSLEPITRRDLWKVFAGQDQVWTYIATSGPFASFDEFAPFIAMRAGADDPYAYAIVDASDHAIGYFTLMRIEPEMRVIEVGHVLYSPGCSARRLAPKPNICSPDMCSRRFAIGATNGNATH